MIYYLIRIFFVGQKFRMKCANVIDTMYFFFNMQKDADPVLCTLRDS